MAKQSPGIASWGKSAAAALLMLLAVLLSRVGLIALIEKGYGTITWGFLIVFVLPVMTIGLAKNLALRRVPIAPFQEMLSLSAPQS